VLLEGTSSHQSLLSRELRWHWSLVVAWESPLVGSRLVSRVVLHQVSALWMNRVASVLGRWLVRLLGLGVVRWLGLVLLLVSDLHIWDMASDIL